MFSPIHLWGYNRFSLMKLNAQRVIKLRIEYMVWPRLAGLAELGWSPTAGRSWTEYRERLGSHGPRLLLMGINFYLSPDVPWALTRLYLPLIEH